MHAILHEQSPHDHRLDVRLNITTRGQRDVVRYSAVPRLLLEQLKTHDNSNEPRRLLDFGPIQGGVSPPVTCSENHQYLTAMAVYHQRIVDAFSVTHLISQEPSIAWLQGRGGRVLRLKIGDLEVEVTAQSEFDVLLAKALAMKAGQPIAELDHE